MAVDTGINAGRQSEIETELTSLLAKDVLTDADLGQVIDLFVESQNEEFEREIFTAINGNAELAARLDQAIIAKLCPEGKTSDPRDVQTLSSYETLRGIQLGDINLPPSTPVEWPAEKTESTKRELAALLGTTNFQLGTPHTLPSVEYVVRKREEA